MQDQSTSDKSPKKNLRLKIFISKVQEKICKEGVYNRIPRLYFRLVFYYIDRCYS